MRRASSLLRRAKGGLLALGLMFPAVASALDATQVDSFLQRLRQQSGAPGVSAAVMVKGELVYSGGAGIGDLEAGTPLNGLSVHNIGSISKTQAVVAVMQLVEQGKVNLDAEIQAYVPWFPRKQAPITLRQILTHTSGIRHYRSGEFGEGEVLRYQQFDDIEQASKRWMNDELLFTPGQHWLYSSYATNLLQALVERVSGERFEAYLRRHVWEPAGMLDTQFDVPDRIVQRRSRGYVLDSGGGRLVNAPQENVSYKYAGGGVISTNEDMLRFGHALNSGLLLKPATMREMLRAQLSPDIDYPPASIEEEKQVDPLKTLSKPPVQALIWRLGTDPWGGRYIEHSGSVKGTYSELVDYQDDDIIVSLHVNAWAVKPDLKQAAEALARLAKLGLPIEAAKK